MHLSVYHRSFTQQCRCMKPTQSRWTLKNVYFYYLQKSNEKRSHGQKGSYRKKQLKWFRNSKHYYSICLVQSIYFQIQHLNVQWKLNFQTHGKNHLNIFQNISKKCKKCLNLISCAFDLEWWQSLLETVQS